MRPVEVFEITPMFGQLSDKFEAIAYVLLVLFLIIVIGIHALKTFSSINLETKLYNFLIAIVLISAWPIILFALKDFVDRFNGFLVHEVFNIKWVGEEGIAPLNQLKEAWNNFGNNVFTWPLKTLNLVAIVALLVSREVIHGLFLVFFFFLAVLGPLIIAKTTLVDEVDGFIDLIRESITLLLWQTTYVIILGLLYVESETGPYIFTNESNVLLQSVKILGIVILTFLIPTITRKYGNHLGTSFVPLVAHYGGVALAAGAVGRFFHAGGKLVHLGGLAQIGARLQSGQSRAESGGKWGSVHGNNELQPARGTSFVSRPLFSPFESEPSLPVKMDTPSGSPLLLSMEKISAPLDIETSAPVRKAKKAEVFAGDQKDRFADGVSLQDQPIIWRTEGMGNGLPLPGTESKVPTMGAVLEREAALSEGRKSGRRKLSLQGMKEDLALMRGPKNSQKYNDMEAVGISHDRLTSGDLTVLERYKQELWLFNLKFGDRYDVKGRFVREGGEHPTEEGFKDAFEKMFGHAFEENER